MKKNISCHRGNRYQGDETAQKNGHKTVAVYSTADEMHRT
jgi:hypothetical protein